MNATLTALYDLARSPVTFDFAYAVAQAEVQRRLEGRDRLVFHVRGSLARPGGDAYASGEAEWRLRHILAPLAGLLERPAKVVIDPSDPLGPVFDRPGGLHWFSDLVLLAEAGHDVQVFKAAPGQRAAVRADLGPRVGGRRVVTVTLRETVYAATRNSDLAAWAALCRRIPRKDYAVVVLRDLDKVSEPLPGDWGEVLTDPAAVWSLARRMALYEEAWINLGVNNGPMVLPILSGSCRFLVFKMLLDTPETSRQHFRRLGIEPGTTFPFLGRDQGLVWDSDDPDRLCDLVLPILDGGPFPVARPAPPAERTLVDAARRDYRWGQRGSTSIACLPPGGIDPEVEKDVAVMRREEAHLPSMNGAQAGPAPTSRSSALSDPVTMAGGGAVPGPIPLPQEESASDMLDRLAASLSARAGRDQRISSGRPAVEVLSAAAMFSGVVGFSGTSEDAEGGGSQPSLGSAAARATPAVPLKAAALFKRWRDSHGLTGRAFALVDGTDRPLRSDGLHPVDWQALCRIWPIEMLAALVEAATAVETRDPLAIRLEALFGRTGDTAQATARSANDVIRLLHHGRASADPIDALIALSTVVRLEPDDPAHRWAFARRFSSHDWTIPGEPDASAEVVGILAALSMIFQIGGPVAVTCEPAASRLVLARPTLVAALVDAAGRSGDDLFHTLSGSTLNDSAEARLLCSLVGGVRIDEGDLLALLDEVRIACGWALLGGAEPPEPLPSFIEALARQVWIQDGPFLGWDDDDLEAAIATADSARIEGLLLRLFPV